MGMYGFESSVMHLQLHFVSFYLAANADFQQLYLFSPPLTLLTDRIQLNSAYKSLLQNDSDNPPHLSHHRQHATYLDLLQLLLRLADPNYYIKNYEKIIYHAEALLSVIKLKIRCTWNEQHRMSFFSIIPFKESLKSSTEV